MHSSPPPSAEQNNRLPSEAVGAEGVPRDRPANADLSGEPARAGVEAPAGGGDFAFDGVDPTPSEYSTVSLTDDNSDKKGSPAGWDFATNECLGRYRLEREVGRGGFARVWKAFDPALQRHVAIKVLRADRQTAHSGRGHENSDQENSGDENNATNRVTPMLEEARRMALLALPGVVPVYDVVEVAGQCCIVSKFIGGGTLATRLARQRPSRRVAAAWTAEIAETLHQSHLRDIVHRDIKPGNILLDENDRPLVADFGLAVSEFDQARESSGVLGTYKYMSPEQARGDSNLVDGRADVYSLGMVLYEMLTGRVAFSADSVESLVEQVLRRPARPPRMVDDTIPPALERVCLKCLAKSPADRYTTAGDLARDLRDWLARPEDAAASQREPAPVPPPPPPIEPAGALPPAAPGDARSVLPPEPLARAVRFPTAGWAAAAGLAATACLAALGVWLGGWPVGGGSPRDAGGLADGVSSSDGAVSSDGAAPRLAAPPAPPVEAEHGPAVRSGPAAFDGRSFPVEAGRPRVESPLEGDSPRPARWTNDRDPLDWASTVGQAPRELIWPGYRRPLGEPLGMRAVDRAYELASEEPRFIELGRLTAPQGAFSVGVRQAAWSQASAGVFWGYRVIIHDGRPTAVCQAIFIKRLPTLEGVVAPYAARELLRVSPKTGLLESRLELGMRRLIWKPDDRARRLEIQLSKDGLSAARFGEEELANFASPACNSRAAPEEHAGAWGVFHEYGVTWFHDPLFTPE